MRVLRTGDWEKARRMLEGAARKAQRGLEAAVREEARRARAEVVQGIRKQAPGGKRLPPPSPLTLASRRLEQVRGTKALRATGELERAVTSVVRGLEAFVGILGSKRGSDGRSLAQVARVQEDGAGPIVVRITPAMRRFLAALRKRARQEPSSSASRSSGVVVVTIPPRPFLTPAFRAAVRGAERRLREHVARRFGLR